MTTTSIDIDRPAEQVYDYVTDPTQFHEWQQGVVSGGIKEPRPAAVGSHSQMVRRIGIDVDFDGHGIGKVLVPLLVRRQAAKEMPENLARLKSRLETQPARPT